MTIGVMVVSQAFWYNVWTQGFTILWSPEVMAIAALAAVGYLVLAGPLSEGRDREERASGRQWALFFLMLALFFVAFGSPVAWLGDHAFFSVHTVQHIVDTLVFPPLMLLSLPRWSVRRALGWRPLAVIWRAFTRPAVAIALWGGVITLWHTQPLYHFTVVSLPVHVIEHGSMFAVGLAFWWPVLSPLKEWPRLADLGQAGYLLLGNFVCWPLFYTLALYPGKVLYPFYIHVYQRWGVAQPQTFAYADQRTGGILMMTVMFVILGSGIAAAFFRWRHSDAEDEAYADDTGRQMA